MSPEILSFGCGTVVYWDMANLSVERTPVEQTDRLKEDLAQVSYGQGFVLDLGWYPSFEEDGHFVVVVIRDQDWESPVFSEKCREWPELKATVQRAIGSIKAEQSAICSWGRR